MIYTIYTWSHYIPITNDVFWNNPLASRRSPGASSCNKASMRSSLPKPMASRGRKPTPWNRVSWALHSVLGHPWSFKHCTNGYPLVMTNITIELITIEIVNFPMNSMVIFHSYVSLPMGNSQHGMVFFVIPFHGIAVTHWYPLIHMGTLLMGIIMGI